MRALPEQERSASSISPERCWIAWVSGIRPMLTLHVVTASTRDGRKGRGVAEWFLTQARAHGKFAIEDVDLAAINLPMFESVTIPFFAQHFTADTGAFD